MSFDPLEIPAQHVLNGTLNIESRQTSRQVVQLDESPSPAPRSSGAEEQEHPTQFPVNANSGLDFFQFCA